MSHKAYTFNWRAFQTELVPLLLSSLMDDDVGRLIEFGNANLSSLSDPYEGEPLASNWTDHLEVGDVQEVADYVLTKYYNAARDGGIGGVWLSIEPSLTEQQKAALLGHPFGPDHILFDPGRMGSFFQDEEESRMSLATLLPLGITECCSFIAILQEAVPCGRGVYVTF